MQKMKLREWLFPGGLQFSEGQLIKIANATPEDLVDVLNETPTEQPHSELVHLAKLLCEINSSTGAKRKRLAFSFQSQLNMAARRCRLAFWPNWRVGVSFAAEDFPWSAFIYHLARLAETGLRDRLRKCPECSKFFLARHAAKKFCTRRCSLRYAGRKQARDPKRKEYMRKYMSERYWREKEERFPPGHLSKKGR